MLTQVAEIVLQSTPEVLLDERFHQPPGLFPIAQLRGDPEEQARTKISPFLVDPPLLGTGNFRFKVKAASCCPLQVCIHDLM